MTNIDFNRFKNLRFEDFRKLAQDPTLSSYEKIGFPDSYRAGYGSAIFEDIRSKLTNLDLTGQTVLDIGPGCSDLPHLMIEQCRQQSHSLIMVDAKEMLDLLPDEPFLTKIPAYYPDQCPELFANYAGKVDVINCYGVIQLVFAEGNLYRFFDLSLSLLADGGQMLIGEVPNISRRKRFFSSAHGIQYHKDFMQTDEAPAVEFNTLDAGQMDDAVLFSLLLRARAAGFNSYIMPARKDLPMENRREDILIAKP